MIRWLNRLPLKDDSADSGWTADWRVDLNDAQAVEEGAGEAQERAAFLLSALRHVQEQCAQTGECLAGKAFLFQTIIDVDDKGVCGKAIEERAELNYSSGIWNGSCCISVIALAKKLHIRLECRLGWPSRDAEAYCEALGVPYDEATSHLRGWFSWRIGLGNLPV